MSPSTVKSVGQGLDWRVFVRILDNWSWGLRNRTVEYCCSLGFNSCCLKTKTSFAKWTHFLVTVKEWNQCQMFPLVCAVSSGKWSVFCKVPWLKWLLALGKWVLIKLSKPQPHVNVRYWVQLARVCIFWHLDMIHHWPKRLTFFSFSIFYETTAISLYFISLMSSSTWERPWI